MSQHVLVVEDDDGVRSALCRWLVSDGFRVTQLSDGRRVSEVLATDSIDLVVMDVSLPDTDGFRLTSEIRKSHDLGIIILSGRCDLMDRVVGLEMGADDYILKPFEPREMLARVRSVLRRSLPRAGTAQPAQALFAVYAFDGWQVDISAHAVLSPSGTAVTLTSGEYQLLEALVTHANRVLSRDQLIDLTCGGDSPAFDRSIDARIGRLRRKLNDHPREPRYIKTVRNGGYIFAPRVEKRARPPGEGNLPGLPRKLSAGGAVSLPGN